MNKKYIILPGCTDSNRGDQALVWETVRVAKDAGYLGEYYMLSSDEVSKQSEDYGINIVSPILKHPSRRFDEKNNKNYNMLIKIKWGISALFDLIYSLLLLVSVFNQFLLPLSDAQTRAAAKIFKDAEVAFVKGGGFLHSSGGLVSTYKIYYFLYHIIYAQKMGKKVYIMPNSFGPFDGSLVKFMVRKVLSNCELVTTRENISSESLKKVVGIKTYNYPDLAFYLNTESDEKLTTLLQNKQIPIGTKKCVAITVRPYRFDGDKGKNKYKNYQDAISGFVDWLYDNAYYPVFVEHTYCDLEHEQDISCIKDVEKLLQCRTKYAIFSDRSLNCKQLKKVYSYFDYIVGTRFHSVIFSITQRVPAIAITYGGNKGNGIMKDMNMEDLVVPIENITTSMLIKKFIYLTENRESVLSKIDDYMECIDNKRNELIEKMKG